MTSITHEKSVAVLVTEELAAFAKRLTTLPIAADERHTVLNLLAEAAEAMACTTNIIVGDAAPHGVVADPDGTLPPVAHLVDDAVRSALLLVQVRDNLQMAASAAEDMEQDARLVSVGAQDGGQA